MNEVRFTFSLEEANKILEVLSKAPYLDVFKIIGSMHRQIAEMNKLEEMKKTMAEKAGEAK